MSEIYSTSGGAKLGTMWIGAKEIEASEGF